MNVQCKNGQSISEALKASALPNAIEQKELVLRYLKNGKVVATAAGRAYDFLTGEEILGEYLLYSDGVFEWSSSLIYYFEKYNIKLEGDFISHVLSKVWPQPPHTGWFSYAKNEYHTATERKLRGFFIA